MLDESSFKFGNETFLYYGIAIWNELTNEFKEVLVSKQFKKALSVGMYQYISVLIVIYEFK